MKYNQLLKSVRLEIEKPFKQKLERAEQLMRLYANDNHSCVSCSFGKDSMAVAYLATQVNPKIPIVFENTGIEFQETLDLKDKMMGEWNIVELKPETTFWKILDRIEKEHLRLDDGRKHSNICCYHLKEKPFDKWRKTSACSRSFTGLTATESRHRMFIACHKGMEYYSARDGLTKIHPIMFWSEQEVWDFTKQVGLPVNEAYAKYGLERVGCKWCMSHKGWRTQIAKLNPKMYAYLMKHYRKTPTLLSYPTEMKPT